jgi:hypothetical protein
MPRIYLSSSELALYPVAITFSYELSRITALSGAMDRLLARASRRVDSFARKRIVSPPATTIGVGGIAAGGTSLPMTSTLGFDNGQEEAVIIGSGGSQEIIPVAPGGVSVTNWASPYPGTITLAQGCAYSHSAGEAAQGCYQEISKVGNPSGRDMEDAAWSDLDQQAEIALMHSALNALPTTRKIFLKCYPIVTLHKLEHALSIGSEYTDLGTSGVAIHPSAGWIRMPVGSLVTAEGLFRATYTAGFTTTPEEIQEATAWYVADELQSMQSRGAYEIQSGKTKVKYADPNATKSIYAQNAEDIIRRGYRRTA